MPEELIAPNGINNGVEPQDNKSLDAASLIANEYWADMAPEERAGVSHKPFVYFEKQLQADKTRTFKGRGFRDGEEVDVDYPIFAKDGSYTTKGLEYLDRVKSFIDIAAKLPDGGVYKNPFTGKVTVRRSVLDLLDKQKSDKDAYPRLDTWLEQNDSIKIDGKNPPAKWGDYVAYVNKDREDENKIDPKNENMRKSFERMMERHNFDPNSMGDDEIVRNVGGELVINPKNLSEIDKVEKAINDSKEFSPSDKRRMIIDYHQKVNQGMADIVNAYSFADVSKHGMTETVKNLFYPGRLVYKTGEAIANMNQEQVPTLVDELKDWYDKGGNGIDFLRKNKERMTKDSYGLASELGNKFRDATMATGTGALFLAGKAISTIVGDDSIGQFMSIPAQEWGELAEMSSLAYKNPTLFHIGGKSDWAFDVTRRDITELSGQIGSMIALGGLGKSLAVGLNLEKGAAQLAKEAAEKAAQKVATAEAAAVAGTAGEAATAASGAIGEAAGEEAVQSGNKIYNFFKNSVSDPTAYFGGVQAGGMTFGRTYKQVLEQTGDPDAAYREAWIQGLSDTISATIATGMLNQFAPGMERFLGWGKRSEGLGSSLIQSWRARAASKEGMELVQTELGKAASPEVSKAIAKAVKVEFGDRMAKLGLTGLGPVADITSEMVEEGLDQFISDHLQVMFDQSKTWTEDIWGKNLSTNLSGWIKSGFLGAIGGGMGVAKPSTFSLAKMLSGYDDARRAIIHKGVTQPMGNIAAALKQFAENPDIEAIGKESGRAFKIAETLANPEVPSAEKVRAILDAAEHGTFLKGEIGGIESDETDIPKDTLSPADTGNTGENTPGTGEGGGTASSSQVSGNKPTTIARTIGEASGGNALPSYSEFRGDLRHTKVGEQDVIKAQQTLIKEIAGMTPQQKRDHVVGEAAKIAQPGDYNAVARIRAALNLAERESVPPSEIHKPREKNRDKARLQTKPTVVYNAGQTVIIPSTVVGGTKTGESVAAQVVSDSGAKMVPVSVNGREYSVHRNVLSPEPEDDLPGIKKPAAKPVAKPAEKPAQKQESKEKSKASVNPVFSQEKDSELVRMRKDRASRGWDENWDFTQASLAKKENRDRIMADPKYSDEEKARMMTFVNGTPEVGYEVEEDANGKFKPGKKLVVEKPVEKQEEKPDEQPPVEQEKEAEPAPVEKTQSEINRNKARYVLNNIESGQGFVTPLGYKLVKVETGKKTIFRFTRKQEILELSLEEAVEHIGKELDQKQAEGAEMTEEQKKAVAEEARAVANLPENATADDVRKAAPISTDTAAVKAMRSKSYKEWYEWLRRNFSHLTKHARVIWNAAAALILSVMGVSSVHVNTESPEAKANFAAVAETSPKIQNIDVEPDPIQSITIASTFEDVNIPIDVRPPSETNEPIPETIDTGGTKTIAVNMGEAPTTESLSYVQRTEKLLANDKDIAPTALDTDLAQEWLDSGVSAIVDAAAELLNEREAGSGAIKQLLAQLGVQESPDQFPWCASFVSWTLNKVGIPSKSLGAREFLSKGTKVTKPQFGDIVVLWNTNPDTGGRYGYGGHVAIYLGETSNHIITISGNVYDAVKVTSFVKERVLGYRHFNEPAMARLEAGRRRQLRVKKAKHSALDAMRPEKPNEERIWHDPSAPEYYVNPEHFNPKSEKNPKKDNTGGIWTSPERASDPFYEYQPAPGRTVPVDAGSAVAIEGHPDEVLLYAGNDGGKYRFQRVSINDVTAATIVGRVISFYKDDGTRGTTTVRQPIGLISANWQSHRLAEISKLVLHHIDNFTDKNHAIDVDALKSVVKAVMKEIAPNVNDDMIVYQGLPGKSFMRMVRGKVVEPYQKMLPSGEMERVQGVNIKERILIDPVKMLKILRSNIMFGSYQKGGRKDYDRLVSTEIARQIAAWVDEEQVHAVASRIFNQEELVKFIDEVKRGKDNRDTAWLHAMYAKTLAERMGGNEPDLETEDGKAQAEVIAHEMLRKMYGLLTRGTNTEEQNEDSFHLMRALNADRQAHGIVYSGIKTVMELFRRYLRKIARMWRMNEAMGRMTDNQRMLMQQLDRAYSQAGLMGDVDEIALKRSDMATKHAISIAEGMTDDINEVARKNTRSLMALRNLPKTLALAVTHVDDLLDLNRETMTIELKPDVVALIEEKGGEIDLKGIQNALKALNGIQSYVKAHSVMVANYRAMVAARQTVPLIESILPDKNGDFPSDENTFRVWADIIAASPEFSVDVDTGPLDAEITRLVRLQRAITELNDRRSYNHIVDLGRDMIANRGELMKIAMDLDYDTDSSVQQIKTFHPYISNTVTYAPTYESMDEANDRFFEGVAMRALYLAKHQPGRLSSVVKLESHRKFDKLKQLEKLQDERHAIRDVAERFAKMRNEIDKEFDNKISDLRKQLEKLNANKAKNFSRIIAVESEIRGLENAKYSSIVQRLEKEVSPDRKLEEGELPAPLERSNTYKFFRDKILKSMLNVYLPEARHRLELYNRYKKAVETFNTSSEYLMNQAIGQSAPDKREFSMYFEFGASYADEKNRSGPRGDVRNSKTYGSKENYLIDYVQDGYFSNILGITFTTAAVNLKATPQNKAGTIVYTIDNTLFPGSGHTDLDIERRAKSNAAFVGWSMAERWISHYTMSVFDNPEDRERFDMGGGFNISMVDTDANVPFDRWENPDQAFPPMHFDYMYGFTKRWTEDTDEYQAPTVSGLKLLTLMGTFGHPGIADYINHLPRAVQDQISRTDEEEHNLSSILGEFDDFINKIETMIDPSRMKTELAGRMTLAGWFAPLLRARVEEARKYMEDFRDHVAMNVAHHLVADKNFLRDNYTTEFRAMFGSEKFKIMMRAMHLLNQDAGFAKIALRAFVGNHRPQMIRELSRMVRDAAYENGSIEFMVNRANIIDPPTLSNISFLYNYFADAHRNDIYLSPAFAHELVTNFRRGIFSNDRFEILMDAKPKEIHVPVYEREQIDKYTKGKLILEPVLDEHGNQMYHEIGDSFLDEDGKTQYVIEKRHPMMRPIPVMIQVRDHNGNMITVQKTESRWEKLAEDNTAENHLLTYHAIKDIDYTGRVERAGMMGESSPWVTDANVDGMERILNAPENIRQKWFTETAYAVGFHSQYFGNRMNRAMALKQAEEFLFGMADLNKNRMSRRHLVDMTRMGIKGLFCEINNEHVYDHLVDAFMSEHPDMYAMAKTDGRAVDMVAAEINPIDFLAAMVEFKARMEMQYADAVRVTDRDSIARVMENLIGAYPIDPKSAMAERVDSFVTKGLVTQQYKVLTNKVFSMFEEDEIAKIVNPGKMWNWAETKDIFANRYMNWKQGRIIENNSKLVGFFHRFEKAVEDGRAVLEQRRETPPEKPPVPPEFIKDIRKDVLLNEYEFEWLVDQFMADYQTAPTTRSADPENKVSQFGTLRKRVSGIPLYNARKLNSEFGTPFPTDENFVMTLASMLPGETLIYAPHYLEMRGRGEVPFKLRIIPGRPEEVDDNGNVIVKAVPNLVVAPTYGDLRIPRSEAMSAMNQVLMMHAKNNPEVAEAINNLMDDFREQLNPVFVIQSIAKEIDTKYRQLIDLSKKFAKANKGNDELIEKMEEAQREHFHRAVRNYMRVLGQTLSDMGIVTETEWKREPDKIIKKLVGHKITGPMTRNEARSLRPAPARHLQVAGHEAVALGSEKAPWTMRDAHNVTIPAQTEQGLRVRSTDERGLDISLMHPEYVSTTESNIMRFSQLLNDPLMKRLFDAVMIGASMTEPLGLTANEAFSIYKAIKVAPEEEQMGDATERTLESDDYYATGVDDGLADFLSKNQLGFMMEDEARLETMRHMMAMTVETDEPNLGQVENAEAEISEEETDVAHLRIGDIPMTADGVNQLLYAMVADTDTAKMTKRLRDLLGKRMDEYEAVSMGQSDIRLFNTLARIVNAIKKTLPSQDEELDYESKSTDDILRDNTFGDFARPVLAKHAQNARFHGGSFASLTKSVNGENNIAMTLVFNRRTDTTFRAGLVSAVDGIDDILQMIFDREANGDKDMDRFMEHEVNLPLTEHLMEQYRAILPPGMLDGHVDEVRANVESLLRDRSAARRRILEARDEIARIKEGFTDEEALEMARQITSEDAAFIRKLSDDLVTIAYNIAKDNTTDISGMAKELVMTTREAVNKEKYDDIYESMYKWVRIINETKDAIGEDSTPEKELDLSQKISRLNWLGGKWANMVREDIRRTAISKFADDHPNIHGVNWMHAIEFKHVTSDEILSEIGFVRGLKEMLNQNEFSNKIHNLMHNKGRKQDAARIAKEVKQTVNEALAERGSMEVSNEIRSLGEPNAHMTKFMSRIVDLIKGGFMSESQIRDAIYQEMDSMFGRTEEEFNAPLKPGDRGYQPTGTEGLMMEFLKEVAIDRDKLVDLLSRTNPSYGERTEPRMKRVLELENIIASMSTMEQNADRELKSFQWDATHETFVGMHTIDRNVIGQVSNNATKKSIRFSINFVPPEAQVKLEEDSFERMLKLSQWGDKWMEMSENETPEYVLDYAINLRALMNAMTDYMENRARDNYKLFKNSSQSYANFNPSQVIVSSIMNAMFEDKILRERWDKFRQEGIEAVHTDRTLSRDALEILSDPSFGTQFVVAEYGRNMEKLREQIIDQSVLLDEANKKLEELKRIGSSPSRAKDYDEAFAEITKRIEKIKNEIHRIHGEMVNAGIEKRTAMRVRLHTAPKNINDRRRLIGHLVEDGGNVIMLASTTARDDLVKRFGETGRDPSQVNNRITELVLDAMVPGMAPGVGSDYEHRLNYNDTHIDGTFDDSHILWAQAENARRLSMGLPPLSRRDAGKLLREKLKEGLEHLINLPMRDAVTGEVWRRMDVDMDSHQMKAVLNMFGTMVERLAYAHEDPATFAANTTRGNIKNVLNSLISFVEKMDDSGNMIQTLEIGQAFMSDEAFAHVQITEAFADAVADIEGQKILDKLTLGLATNMNESLLRSLPYIHHQDARLRAKFIRNYASYEEANKVLGIINKGIDNNTGRTRHEIETAEIKNRIAKTEKLLGSKSINHAKAYIAASLLGIIQKRDGQTVENLAAWLDHYEKGSRDAVEFDRLQQQKAGKNFIKRAMYNFFSANHVDVTRDIPDIEEINRIIIPILGRVRSIATGHWGVNRNIPNEGEAQQIIFDAVAALSSDSEYGEAIRNHADNVVEQFRDIASAMEATRLLMSKTGGFPGENGSTDMWNNLPLGRGRMLSIVPMIYSFANDPTVDKINYPAERRADTAISMVSMTESPFYGGAGLRESRRTSRIFRPVRVNGLTSIASLVDDAMYRINVTPNYTVVRSVFGENVPSKQGYDTVADSKMLRGMGPSQPEFNKWQVALSAVLMEAESTIRNDMQEGVYHTRFSEAMRFLASMFTARALVSVMQWNNQITPPILGIIIKKIAVGRYAEAKLFLDTLTAMGTGLFRKQHDTQMDGTSVMDENGNTVMKTRFNRMVQFTKDTSIFVYLRLAQGFDDHKDVTKKQIRSGANPVMAHIGRAMKEIEAFQEKTLDLTIGVPERWLSMAIYASEIINEMKRMKADGKITGFIPSNIDELLNMDRTKIPYGAINHAQTRVNDMMGQSDPGKKAGVFQNWSKSPGVHALMRTIVRFSNQTATGSSNITAFLPALFMNTKTEDENGNLVPDKDKERMKTEAWENVIGTIAQNTAFHFMKLHTLIPLAGLVFYLLGGDDRDDAQMKAQELADTFLSVGDDTPKGVALLKRAAFGTNKQTFKDWRDPSSARWSAFADLGSKTFTEFSQAIPLFGVLLGYSPIQDGYKSYIDRAMEGSMAWISDNEVADSNMNPDGIRIPDFQKSAGAAIANATAPTSAAWDLGDSVITTARAATLPEPDWVSIVMFLVSQITGTRDLRTGLKSDLEKGIREQVGE